MAGNVRVRNSAVYLEKLQVIHRELGIPEGCSLGRRGPVFFENPDLVRAGSDLYNRPLYLAGATAETWERMRSSGKYDGINLVAVSGFRSIRRQQEIIKKKLDAGRPLTEILRVNAAPGYSQHHTGFAIDLADDSDSEPLSEEFEEHPAFKWLSLNADKFGFSLQYPRGNSLGFIYEPWHWALDAVHDHAFRPESNLEMR